MTVVAGYVATVTYNLYLAIIYCGPTKKGYAIAYLQ